MITKRVNRVKGTSSFRRLAAYILDTAHNGEKVAWARVTNCISDDPLWAIKEIERTQTRNTRSRADRTYHLVVSLAPGERPTREQLFDIEDHVALALGYADHQRLAVVHTDTDCVHLHLAINKVHPRTHRCVTPRRDYYLLDAACRELEHRHGLKRTNRIGEKARQARSPEAHSPSEPTDRARQRRGPAEMEAHAGEQSLLRWIRESARETLEELGASTASWQEAHRVLARADLEIVPRGAGLVLRARATGVAIPASQAKRTLSFQALTGRWGPYEPPDPGSVRIEPEQHYEKEPVHGHPDSARLYTEFQRERQSSLEARKAARAALSEELAREERQIAALHAEARRQIQTGPLDRAARRGAYSSLAVRRKAELAEHRQAARRRRAGIALEHPLATWQEYLRRRAEEGDTSALAVLRARERRERQLQNALLCASSAAEARHVLLGHLGPTVRKDGVVVYRLDDGSTVRDEQREIGVDQPSAGAVYLALILAQERFGTAPIIVEGTEEFRRQVATMAAVRGVEVRFAEEGMEVARATALEQHRKQTAPTALEAFIAERNRTREKVPSVLVHRAWAPGDRGPALYRGRRHLPDGSEAVLLERGGEMLVALVSPAQAAKASRWRLGKSVEMDRHGRFLHPSGRQRDG